MMMNNNAISVRQLFPTRSLSGAWSSIYLNTSVKCFLTMKKGLAVKQEEG
jgi:hypothetical protein